LLQRAVEVFLLFGGKFITLLGLLVQLLDSGAVDRILTLRDAAEGLSPSLDLTFDNTNALVGRNQALLERTIDFTTEQLQNFSTI
jgi:hypothetical protein